MRFRRPAEPEWQFAPHERPAMPGSPASPDHPFGRRVAYGTVGVLVGLTGGLGNALISVNTQYLQGALGLDPAEIAWLPTAYVMTNVCINLLLFKFRQQFGLRLFTAIFVSAYAAITFAHLFVHGFASAVAVRAVSGMAGGALSTLGLYYVMQSFPAKWRLKALVVGIGVPQLAVPMARLFSPELLGAAQWRTLYLFEFGLALVSLAAVLALQLPPGERKKAFEPMDLLTFMLFAPGIALLCAVLGQGRILWWTEAPWLGWALAAAIPLILGAILIEHRRANPLLQTRWLGSADIVRFAVVTLMARIVLSEQTYAAVGLLTTLGQTNDQLGGLFTIILLASVAGIAVSAIMLDIDRLSHPVMMAIGLVAIAAFADSHATNLTRAPQMYVTQAAIAFAGTLFLGPSLLFGMSRALAKGSGHVLSFIALFGIINNLGGLGGSALLGSYQVIREKAHSNSLVQDISLTDPATVLRVQAGAGAYGRVLGDPALRSAEGGALLSAQVTREANILAYDDVFRLIAILAGLTTLYLAMLNLRRWLRARRLSPAPGSP
nr:MFS transporter [Sphingomonas solaris]